MSKDGAFSRDAQSIEETIYNNHLPRFRDAFAIQIEDTKSGDWRLRCHDGAVGLILDLVDANLSDGWSWCYGHRLRNDHSWIQYGDWVLDSAIYHNRMIIVSVEDHFSLFGANLMERQNPEQTIDFLSRPLEEREKWFLEKNRRIMDTFLNTNNG